MKMQNSAASAVTSYPPNTAAIESIKVAIFICTFNGGRFLEEQLDSFVRQSHKNWTIYASDDGSSDETLQILQRYKSKLGIDKLFIINGPRKGFGRNFLSLVNNLEITADYFAFSDQDDIWHEEKLKRSISTLQIFKTVVPLLYCSRTRLVNESGQVIGYSPRFTKTPCFQNALVQSIAGANTMLINNATRKLMQNIDENIFVVAHDWLAYLLVSGCGGEVIYDVEPTLDYRQHSDNLIGANASFRSRISRVRQMFTGRFKDWTSKNLEALATVEKLLTAENQQRIRDFKLARRSRLITRLRLMKKAEVCRQTTIGEISLKIAIAFNKI